MLNNITPLLTKNDSVSLQITSLDTGIRVTVIPRIAALPDDAADSLKQLHAVLARPFVADLAGPDFDAEFTALCSSFLESRSPAQAAMTDITALIETARAEAKSKAESLAKAGAKKPAKVAAAPSAAVSKPSGPSPTDEADTSTGDDDTAAEDGSEEAQTAVETDTTDLFR